MPSFIGPGEIILLALVLLLIFGPKRLPELGRSLGSGFRELKESFSGNSTTTVEAVPVDVTPTEPAALNAATVVPSPVAAAEATAEPVPVSKPESNS